jgi:hypothetical protein
VSKAMSNSPAPNPTPTSANSPTTPPTPPVLHDEISSFADVTLTAGLDGKDVVISFEAEPAADFRPVISVTEEGYTRLEIRTHEFCGYGLTAYLEAFQRIAMMLEKL